MDKQVRQDSWYPPNRSICFPGYRHQCRVKKGPELNGEGENMSTLIDATGKEIGRMFIEIALSEDGEGWIDYKWPKPGETEPSNKRTYIKVVTIDEQAFLVGSGFYTVTN